MAQTVKNLPTMPSRICLQCRRPRVDSWVRKIRWRRDRPPTPVFLGFPCGSVGKKSACNAGDLGSIPELGRSPGDGKGYPLWYSGLENSTDYTAYGVAELDTTERLSLGCVGLISNAPFPHSHSVHPKPGFNIVPLGIFPCC